MRTIRRTGRFKRDYKREAKGPHRATLDQDLLALVSLLADASLPEKYRDHAMAGEWPDDGTLELVRLGSHSELSL